MNTTSYKPDPNSYGLGFCGKKNDDTYFFGFTTPPNETDLNSVDSWHEFLKWFEEEFPAHTLQSVWRCLFKDFEQITNRTV